MEFVRAARMLGGQARVHLSDVTPLVYDLGEALFDVLLISLRLLVAMARPVAAALLALRRALTPTFLAAASAAWHVFVSQSPEALALEAALGGGVLLLLALEVRFGVLRGVLHMCSGVMRGVARWYAGVKRGVREKSRLAAAALSHFVFVVPCLVASLWFGRRWNAFARAWGVFAVACVRPVWKTAAALYGMEEEHIVADGHGAELVPVRTGAHGSVREGIAFEEVSDVDSDEASDEARGGDTDPLAGTGVEDTRSPERGPDCSVDRGAASAENDLDGESGQDSDRKGVHEAEHIPLASGLRRRQRQSATGSLPAGVNATASPRTTVTPTRGPVTPKRARRSAQSVERIAKTNEMDLLRYWSVFGVIWAGRGLAHYFSPSLFAPVLLRLDLLLFYLLLWLQIGLTRGSELLFPVLASALRQGHHLRSNASAGAEQLNVFLRVLVSVGAVNAERAAMITSNLTESGVVLLGVIFFITPRAATYVGTLLTGYLVPVYFTVFAATPVSPPVTRHTWLSYWATFAVVEAVHVHLSKNLDWVPLWYHGKLALILWLQIPYYRGASTLLDSGMRYFGSLVSACRRTTVTPRKVRID